MTTLIIEEYTLLKDAMIQHNLNGNILNENKDSDLIILTEKNDEEKKKNIFTINNK